MAIIKLSESVEEGKVVLEINNGHLETLNKITDDYNIQDIEKTLGFLLAVIVKNEGRPIHIGEDTFIPGEAILKKKTEPKEISSETTEEEHENKE